MYLKQIEMENFKSFEKRMTIPLLEGYTAVTGPNGSGKSNISDAILFVLGPRSSRAIRAGKLTDLIFNGGKSKKQATFTKVSLVFENADRIIPLDTDTVKLTRLVKLSQGGEGYNSYFYVNGRRSSLTEFDDLLSNSRISADGYNVVQQGDVTHIVEMTDLERRRILDDISGISKFDQDIEKAERERGEAERNIERIAIIQEELRKQLVQLEREREAALKYLTVKEKMDLARAQMACKRRESTLTEIASIREQLENHESEIEDLRQSRQRMIDRMGELDAQSVQLDKEIEEKGGEEFRQLKERVDELKIELARAQDAADRANDDAEELREQLEERGEEPEALREELERVRGELEQAKADLKARSRLLEKAKERKSSLESSIRETDDRLQGLEDALAEMEAGLKADEERWRSLTLEDERLEARRERLQEELADQEEQRKNIEFEISDIDWNLKQIKGETRDHSKRLKEAQEVFHARKREETKLDKEAAELEQAIRRLNREYNHLKAEAEAAESVARGYTRAVQAILEARDRGTLKGVHGTIAELARVEEEHEVALNVAAGSRMQAIVVDDDEVASKAIQMLKKGDLGRATFLPLNKMREYRPKGRSLMVINKTLGFAIDLIDFDDRYRAAFSYVLGDTMVVDSLDKARQLMGGVRLVTLEGELIEASGAMVGGTLQGSKLKFGASARGKLEEVGQQLQSAIQQSERVSEELRQARADLLELERIIREISGTGGFKDERVRELEGKKEGLKVKLSKLKAQLDEKRKELGTIEGQLKETKEALREVEGRLKAEGERRDAARAEIIDLAPKGLSQRLREVEGEIHELTDIVSQLRAKIGGLETNARLLEERKAEMDSLLQETERKIEELRVTESRFKEKVVSLRTELAGMRKIEESMGEEMKGLRERKDSLFKERTTLELERDRIDGRIETSNDFSIGLRTKMSLAEERLREVDQEIDGFEVKVEPPLPTLERIKETLRECESSLSSMEAVNLRAIDDYEEKRARQESLSEEVSRLEAQRKDLLALMKELNQRKKISFLRVFEAVSENFKRVYADLSAGGEAELMLQDPEEPFNGGLIIRARPKTGKTLRLQALSGGEKSLTALSFIFAIQEYQPSPFYLLDEVDMFLDAVNADMVAKRVQRASRSAQFMQITLRKVTMNKADHIVGVTMQEEGVSKVIMRPNIEEEILRSPSGRAVEGTS